MAHPTRRTLLRWTGAGAGLALAGCGPLPPPGGAPPGGGPVTGSDASVPSDGDAAPGDDAMVVESAHDAAAAPVDAAPMPVPGGVPAGFPLLAQITLFGGNFEPRGWARCDGRILAISSNTALFSLLGTTFGGDGRTTFALPSLAPLAGVHHLICVSGVYPSRA